MHAGSRCPIRHSLARQLRVWLGVSLLVACAQVGAFQALAPGEDPALEEDLTVNVVRIGLRGLVDEAAFTRHLPPANWVARSREGGGRKVEIAFRYRYNVVDVPAGFEDFLFGVMRAIAVPQPAFKYFDDLPPLPILVDQVVYNFCNLDPAAHPGEVCNTGPGAVRVNPRMITQSHLLDAAVVEALLAINLPALGIDVRNPTIVLLNWWGRPDYVDHAYLQPDDPVRETGVPRGLYMDNALGGWGGTPHDDAETCARLPCVPHRLWFVDLSAGPFMRNGSWDLVAAIERSHSMPRQAMDYRLHHIADYLHAGTRTYRPLDTLTEDLASRLVGDVFLGTIATAASVYPPALSPPKLPQDVRVNLHRYRWGDSRNLETLFSPSRLTATLNQLPYSFSTSVQERPDPSASRLGNAARNLFTTTIDPVYGQRLHPVTDLYFYWKDHIREFTTGAADYEVSLFQFALHDLTGVTLAGFADSNWATLESYPNANGARLRQTESLFLSGPQEAPFYSHVIVAAHEVGHHMGLHHPFHGSRCMDSACEQLRRIEAIGDTFYSRHGMFVHGVMTYVHVNGDFSRFERDNVARWVTYQHLRRANALAGALLRNPQVANVGGHLANADAHAAAAVALFRGMHYEDAAARARAASALLAQAAAILRLPLEPPAEAADVQTPPDLHMAARIELRQFSTAGEPVRWMRGLPGLGLHPDLQRLAGQVHRTLPAGVLPTRTDVLQLRYQK